MKLLVKLGAMLAIAVAMPCVAQQGAPAAHAKKLQVPATQQACLAKGGEWIPVMPGNPTYYCFMLTSDGGKPCKNSKDCQSVCIEEPQGNKCASTYTGCFEPTGHGTVKQCVN
jgi:hypothetical protein